MELSTEMLSRTKVVNQGHSFPSLVPVPLDISPVFFWTRRRGPGAGGALLSHGSCFPTPLLACDFLTPALTLRFYKPSPHYLLVTVPVPLHLEFYKRESICLLLFNDLDGPQSLIYTLASLL